MKAAFFTLFLLLGLVPALVHSQSVINFSLIDDGVKQGPENTKHIVVVKNYGDTLFERLEYQYAGPLIKATSYKDHALTIKNGPYRAYNTNGLLQVEGNYTNDQRDGQWDVYNDSSLHVRETKYVKGAVVYDRAADSIAWYQKNAAKGGVDTTAFVAVDREAKADPTYLTYLTDSLHFPERAAKLKAHGTVEAQFAIDSTGQITDISLVRSVEYSLDEAIITLLLNAPRWTPAIANGKPIKAYRRQKLTFPEQ